MTERHAKRLARARRAAFAAGAALLGLLALAPGRAEAAQETPTVVELYTSQGCSSCPPADAFLSELARNEGIIALSFHVNYWDYIGWQDPFASEATTARQRAYARVLNQRYVFTPEMVVDGSHGAIGSHRDKVRRAIREAAEADRLRVPLTAAITPDGQVEVTVPAAPFEGEAAVWLVEFDDEHVTRVGRGENRGRTLTNTNVVREIRRIGTWTGEELNLTASLGVTSGEVRDGCVVIVQAEEVGPVIGATKVALTAER